MLCEGLPDKAHQEDEEYNRMLVPATFINMPTAQGIYMLIVHTNHGSFIKKIVVTR